MNIKIVLSALFCLFISTNQANATDTLKLGLKQAIALAQAHSPQAESARHSFRSAYWNYRYYRANYLPAVTLTTAPYLDRAINKITINDGTVKFVEQNLLSTDLTLSVTQNIAFTGGTLFLESTAQRIDLLGDKQHSWQTSPISIGYKQAILGYNSLKWDKRIEPIRYQEAKKSLIEALELIATLCIEKFFNLAQAQSNYLTANSNYAKADTLYKYAQGRYNIGTISENEMLQLELNKLTEETNQMNARIEVENCMQEFRSFLGIQQDCELEAIIDENIPDFYIDPTNALLLANENSPEMLSLQRRKLESESNVAYARSNAGLKADIYLRLGLTQTASKFKDAYKNPLEQQYISLGVSLPILDWGRGRGKVRVARSNRDLVFTQVKQEQNDFAQTVQKLVKQFNIQGQRVHLAARTSKTAQRRAEVARKLYLLGKSNILDLNASISEKDNSRRNYLAALNNYWSMYYTLRSLTHYDFEKQLKIEEDFERLIKYTNK